MRRDPIPRWLLLTCVAAVAAIFTLAGCSSYNDHRGKGDAPVENRKGDDTPAQVINMPDDFRNMAIKCIKGSEPWAFVNTTTDDAMLIQDPAKCGGKVLTAPLQVRPPMQVTQEN